MRNKFPHQNPALRLEGNPTASDGIFWCGNKDQEIKELFKLLNYEQTGSNPHLDSKFGAGRYIKDADLVKKYLPAGKILDWGCGLGQMSFLLKKRGLEVASYDVDPSGKDFLSRFGQPLIVADDQSKLPFADTSFDAVLSSGVLEHVADPAGSLKEISRVIKPGGYFFIFRLPNRYSYIEFISDRLGRGDHPVKYSLSEIKATLERLGYEIRQIGYKGFVPYNLKGFPAMVRGIYHRFDALLERLEAFFAVFPIINRLSTNLELVARKR